ncbi:MAG: 3-deoxy-8-phosphooctulonate synthase [Rhodobacteraceae bacterium]|nr:3-deoxy-8-phosphooctulonate synthase [Paracoccaceae bacterium]
MSPALKSRTLKIGSIALGNTEPLVLIGGPCQIESRTHALMIAETLAEITERLGMGFIFKASFDKANRTSLAGRRGAGLKAGLEILAAVRHSVGCPVLTDVHEPGQCDRVADVVEILQIPAFLCRQTDLLLAAAATGRCINVKKGQFLAPWDVEQITGKIESEGNRKIMLCERGTSFGYNTLVADMRSIPILARTGYPVIMDATHAVQQPGGAGHSSGGQREFAPVIARAAVSLGVAAIFLETHEAPDRAPSDGPNMIPLNAMESVLAPLLALDRIAKDMPLCPLSPCPLGTDQ